MVKATIQDAKQFGRLLSAAPLLGVRRKMKIIVYLFLVLFTKIVFAEKCMCESPEKSLDYYLNAIQGADSEAVISMYWGTSNFTIREPRGLKTYKILRNEKLTKDMQFEDWPHEVPLWAKKDSVQIDVIQVWSDGLEEKYFYSFRFIEDKWYMVGHGSENMSE